MSASTILTPDQRLRVFVSSTLGELARERRAVQAAIEGLRLTPVLFELGARPHPPRQLYRAYLAQSDVFVGIYAERYGWIAPGEEVSGLEDEYRLAGDRPRLLYLKSVTAREPRLDALVRQMQADDRASYRTFSTAEELGRLVAQDLAVLLSERFASSSGVSPSRARRLPRPLTATVGRDQAIRRVRDLLDRRVRLLTLIGPGGIGKSRLALEVAAASADDFEGVHFVPLAAVEDVALVLHTVADRMGLRVEGTQSALDAVAEGIAASRTLLVLDNLEHLVGAAADIAALLERCPALSVLTTSRTPLRLRGEQELQVEPLTLPADDDPEEIARSSAVQLLLDRVRAVRPDADLTHDLPALAELARRLDGLPLAIELVAPRLRVLTPPALLDRLEGVLDLPAASRDVPPRQQTLRATFDWSYELLSDPAATLLAELSVFAGGASLTAVEQVCSVGEGALDTLAELVDLSFITPDSDPPGREIRFSMPELVHQYAAERLADEASSERLRAQHLAFFARLSRAAQPYLCGPHQREWSERFDAERANIRGAVHHGLDAGDRATVLQLVWDTLVYYFIRDAFHEPMAWLRRLAEDRTGFNDVEDADLDVALAIAGLLDEHDVVRRLEHATGIYRDEGLGFHLAVANHHLGLALWRVGQPERARSVLRDASTGYAALGHDWGVSITSSARGAMCAAAGHLTDALTLHNQALAHARAIDNRPLELQALQGIGITQALAGDDAAALAALRDAAELVLVERHATGAAHCLDALALLLHRTGRHEAAAHTMDTADRARAHLGTPDWTAANLLRASISAVVGAPPTSNGTPRPATPAEAFDAVRDALQLLTADEDPAVSPRPSSAST